MYSVVSLFAFAAFLRLSTCVPVVFDIEGRQYSNSNSAGMAPATGTGMTGTGMTAPAAPVYNTTADISVLQYALTLENLEANFYIQALANVTQAQYMAAGLSARDYNIITQVRDHEVTHVNTLSGAIKGLGATPVPACTYNFPKADAPTILAIARALENTGVSAYDGAVGDISNPAYLSVAATIVTVEARHAAFFNYITGKAPASQPFDIPLGRRQIITIASPFILSCPYTLPMAFPALTVTPASGPVGTALTVSSSANLAGMQCAFIGASSTLFAPVTNGQCTVPSGALGDLYIVVTSSSSGVNDANTIAGPATYSVGTVGDAPASG